MLELDYNLERSNLEEIGASIAQTFKRQIAVPQVHSPIAYSHYSGCFCTHRSGYLGCVDRVHGVLCVSNMYTQCVT